METYVTTCTLEHVCVRSHHWANEWFSPCWQHDRMWVRVEQQDLGARWAAERPSCSCRSLALSSWLSSFSCAFLWQQVSYLSFLDFVYSTWVSCHVCLLSSSASCVFKTFFTRFSARSPWPQMRLRDRSISSQYVCEHDFWILCECRPCVTRVTVWRWFTTVIVLIWLSAEKLMSWQDCTLAKL